MKPQSKITLTPGFLHLIIKHPNEWVIQKIKLEDETQEDVSNEVSVVNVLQNIDNITNQVVEPQATEPAKEKKRKRTAKVLLTNHYNTTLAQYSGLNSLKARQSGNQGPTFLCVCGKKEETDSSPPIECTVCHKKQHSSCVHYDLEDPLRGPYRCPRCWIDIEPLKSGATLIITPPSISNQWVEEIRRHVKADHLKVLLYKVHNFIVKHLKTNLILKFAYKFSGCQN